MALAENLERDYWALILICILTSLANATPFTWSGELLISTPSNAMILPFASFTAETRPP